MHDEVTIQAPSEAPISHTFLDLLAYFHADPWSVRFGKGKEANLNDEEVEALWVISHWRCPSHFLHSALAWMCPHYWKEDAYFPDRRSAQYYYYDDDDDEDYYYYYYYEGDQYPFEPYGKQCHVRHGYALHNAVPTVEYMIPSAHINPAKQSATPPERDG